MKMILKIVTVPPNAATTSVSLKKIVYYCVVGKFKVIVKFKSSILSNYA
jgi:hypothetical protein